MGHQHDYWRMYPIENGTADGGRYIINTIELKEQVITIFLDIKNMPIPMYL